MELNFKILTIVLQTDAQLFMVNKFGASCMVQTYFEGVILWHKISVFLLQYLVFFVSFDQ